jgi:hypothetical protein
VCYKEAIEGAQGESMTLNAAILEALATSCRMLSDSNQSQLADKREVFEFYLQWLNLGVRYRDSASTAELSKQLEAQFDDLALRMAQFILNRG